MRNDVDALDVASSKVKINVHIRGVDKESILPSLCIEEEEEAGRLRQGRELYLLLQESLEALRLVTLKLRVAQHDKLVKENIQQ